MIPENNRTKELKERWRRWFNARSDWDTQAREDIDFYLGNHYTAEDQILFQRGINQIPPWIDFTLLLNSLKLL